MTLDQTGVPRPGEPRLMVWLLPVRNTKYLGYLINRLLCKPAI